MNTLWLDQQDEILIAPDGTSVEREKLAALVKKADQEKADWRRKMRNCMTCSENKEKTGECKSVLSRPTALGKPGGIVKCVKKEDDKCVALPQDLDEIDEELDIPPPRELGEGEPMPGFGQSFGAFLHGPPSPVGSQLPPQPASDSAAEVELDDDLVAALAQAEADDLDERMAALDSGKAGEGIQEMEELEPVDPQALDTSENFEEIKKKLNSLSHEEKIEKLKLSMEGTPDSYKDLVMAAFKEYGITQEQLEQVNSGDSPASEGEIEGLEESANVAKNKFWDAFKKIPSGMSLLSKKLSKSVTNDPYSLLDTSGRRLKNKYKDYLILYFENLKQKDKSIDDIRDSYLEFIDDYFNDAIQYDKSIIQQIEKGED